MKIKLILKIAGSFMLILSLFMISLDELTFEEKDFTESDEDLLTVDYKDFYDQLSGHGE